MKGLYFSAKTLAMLAAFFGFLFTWEITALAQRTPSSIQRRVDQLNRQGEQYERDNLGREVNGDKTDRRRSQALVFKVKKDLEGLQAGYNEIVLAMAANKSADDAHILRVVGEISECSARLKHNLALPLPKDDKKAPETATAPQIEAPLMALRKHIYSFVMNPLFESSVVLEVQHAQNASRDLDKIIEISESISKHARKKTSNSR